MTQFYFLNLLAILSLLKPPLLVSFRWARGMRKHFKAQEQ
jgi:hypothetical protein